MVERRERGRTRLVNHPVAIEFTFTATGEYGAVEALEKVCAAMWADWRDAYNEWMQGDAGGVSPFQAERLEPSEWRLTDQGVMARQDLANGRQDVVFDFVLKRGFFDGRPRLLPDGRISQRGPVRGRGELLCMEKVRVDAAVTGTVNVGNWSEGADSFAAAFAGLFALTRPPAVLPGEAAPSGRKGKGRDNLRSWTQEDLDKAILQYKAARAATYADLREGLRKDSPVARKAAREVYGRNAIARALGVKSPSMVSKSQAWMAIAEELGLELRRGRKRGTDRPEKAAGGREAMLGHLTSRRHRLVPRSSASLVRHGSGSLPADSATFMLLLPHSSILDSSRQTQMLRGPTAGPQTSSVILLTRRG